MVSFLFENILRPLIFRLDPEQAHALTIKVLQKCPPHLLGSRYQADPVLKQTIWGRSFANPVGLAAGFDKNADVIAPMLHMGFGFVEAGTVTPKAQDGNPKPRIFRDPVNDAVINRMGFPGGGLDIFRHNIEQFLELKPRPPGLVGINIGMNKDQTAPLKDYAKLVRVLGPYADYLTVNISSPNTPGLRDLQKRENLKPLLDGVMEMRDKACGKHPPPLLVKFSPDEDLERWLETIETLAQATIDGIILTNTTLDRPDHLPPAFAAEKGGLSGRPLREKSLNVVRHVYAISGGKLPIIGVGGISSGDDAYAMIRAGASLVQLYSALVFKGPYIARSICDGLTHLLKADGFSNIQEAIGADHIVQDQSRKAV